jgi:hypothetical protein
LILAVLAIRAAFFIGMACRYRAEAKENAGERKNKATKGG